MLSAPLCNGTNDPATNSKAFARGARLDGEPLSEEGCIWVNGVIEEE